MAELPFETRTLEQLTPLTALSPDALTAVQEPGGPVGRVSIKQLLGRLVQTDTAKETRADLLADLDHNEPAVALVYADADPALNGWYRKTGAIGAGTWTQFEKLSAFAAAEIAEYVSTASAAADTATSAADAAQALTNFRLTLAEGVADFPVGAYFSSAESGELRGYRRIADAPYYEDLGDVAAPVTKGLLSSPGGAAMVANRPPVGDDLRTQPISDFINNNILQPSQFAGTAEQRFLRAVAEATASRDGGQGQTVLLPRGEFEITEPFNIENRSSIIGVNKRGSRIKAAAGFEGDFMATIYNGGISSFDNALERLTLDCDGIPGLSGVDSYAWQEGGGLRNVLIEGFQAYGVKFSDGDGGAANCVIEDSELFGGVIDPAVAGIRVDEISAIGSFVLRVSDTTIAGRDGVQMPKGIDIANDSSVMFAVHFEEVETGIYLDGVGHHIIQCATGHNTVENLIEIAPTFTGSVTLIACQRAGATNFLKDNRPTGYGTISGRDIANMRIDNEPPLYPGAIVASASIDGTGVPSVTRGFGVSSIDHNGVGDYTIHLTRSAQSASDFTVFASTNAGAGNVRCDLNGVGSVRVRCFAADGATAADVNELKILVVCVA